MVTKERDFPDSGRDLLLEANIPGIELFNRGKVRDTYRIDSDNLLMVATDRVSAFDVVLPAGIPDKGCVLNLMSAFWFEKTAHIVPNHLVAAVENLDQLSHHGQFPDYVMQRSMVVREAERIDVECVVRGFLAGSAWAEYSQNGTVNGQPMPSGLRENQMILGGRPLFTPTTKAKTGHDQPISLEELTNMVGADTARELEEKSIAVYKFAYGYAFPRGIVIADTKIEFGFINGELCLIDELLTPDSSRFLDLGVYYSPSEPHTSFDKQYLRDYLIASGWNKEPPAPPIPPDVVERTAEKYREAYRRLTGKTL